MKLLLSTGIFMLAISTVNAGPGASRMAAPEMLQNTSRGVYRTCTGLGGLRMSDRMFDRFSHTRKSFFHTKLKTEGYKPKETAEIPQRHILPWPKKVEYLDDTYEIFRTPPGFKEKLEESVKRSHTEQSLPEKVEKKK